MRCVSGSVMAMVLWIGGVVWAQDLPNTVFVGPKDAGHWEYLGGGYNDQDGEYAPLKLYRSADGTDVRWVMDPGWLLKITSDGLVHADNGNDAILAYRADRDTGFRWEVRFENQGSPVFFSVAQGNRTLNEGQIGKETEDTWRGTVELKKGEAIFFRTGLKHLHAGRAEQHFRIRPALKAVGRLPEISKLALAKNYPTVNGEAVFPIGFLHYATDAPLMTELRKMGFDATEADIGWNQIESEKGRFDSTVVKKHLDEVAKHDMRLLLLFSWHYYPWWLSDDWRFRDSLGKPCGAGWLPASIWKPEVRAHQAKVVEAVCQAAAKHPATLGYVLANEPDMGDFTVGYEDEAVQAFRAWLKKNYKTASDLNRRWGTNLAGFDAVEPPRPAMTPDPTKIPRPIADLDLTFPPRVGLEKVNRAAWLDWITFRNESFADYWVWLAGEIRKHHPGANITHKMMWKGMSSDVAARMQQNYRLWSRAVSVSGGDIYPHPYENITLRWEADAFWSFGGGKFSWVNEHNVGFQELRPDYPLIPAESYSAWLWQGIGRGLRGFFHWMMTLDLQAPDGGSYCFGDGTFAPSFWVTQREVTKIRKLQPYLVRSRPTDPQIAILHSWPTLIQQPGREIGAYATSVLEGLYRAHLRVGFIDETMLRSGEFGNLKAILLPGAFCLSAADWAALEGFVKRGGWVIAWPKSGDFDELNRLSRDRVSRLFGVQITGQREKALKPSGYAVREVFRTQTFQKKPAEKNLFVPRYAMTPAKICDGDHVLKSLAGQSLTGGGVMGFEDFETPQEYRMALKPAGAAVVATFDDGTPAVMQNGRFVYIAVSPMTMGDSWHTAMRTLLEAGGIEPEGYVRDATGRAIPHIDFATLQGEGFRLVIVTNHALSRDYDGRPVAGARIGIRGSETMRVVRMLDVEKELTPTIRGEYGEIEGSFLAGEAKVFLVVP